MTSAAPFDAAGSLIEQFLHQSLAVAEGTMRALEIGAVLLFIVVGVPTLMLLLLDLVCGDVIAPYLTHRSDSLTALYLGALWAACLRVGWLVAWAALLVGTRLLLIGEAIGLVMRHMGEQADHDRRERWPFMDIELGPYGIGKTIRRRPAAPWDTPPDLHIPRPTPRRPSDEW